MTKVLCCPYLTGRNSPAKDTKTWQEKLTTWGAKLVADTARLRKAEETTPAELWKERHRKGHKIMGRYEVDPNRERQKLLAQVGRPRGKGRHRIKMGRSTSQNMLEVEAQITEFKEYKDGKSSDTQIAQNTDNLSERQPRQEQQLEKTKRKKAATKFQEIHEGFLVEKNSFFGTRVLRWQSRQRDRGTRYGQQQRSSSAHVLPFPQRHVLRPAGEKSHSRPYSRGKVYLQLDVDGEVHYQLGLHLKKEGYASVNFLTSHDTAGASEIIRECESENEDETSLKVKEVRERRHHGRKGLVLAREEYHQYNHIGEELFQKELETKALYKVIKVRRMSGSTFRLQRTHTTCVCLSSQQAAVLFRRQL